jgi:hydroxymethylbilane synthase
MRLGLGDRIRARFDVERMIPAAGQGALGLEIRVDAAALHGRLAALRDPDAWLATHAERAVARSLGGSCSMPLAAYAERAADGRFTLRAALGDAALAGALEGAKVDAKPLLCHAATAELADVAAAEAFGAQVAAALLAAGGRDYLPADAS